MIIYFHMNNSIDLFIWKSIMISMTTQYALKALVILTSLEPETAILGRDLAARAGIPANYLSKVLLSMRNAGLVFATRGTGGGYRLEKTPAEIRLIEVFEIFEAPRTEPPCLLGQGLCSEADPCSAHHAWTRVRSTYLDFLETTTLADISKHPSAGKVEFADSSEEG